MNRTLLATILLALTLSACKKQEDTKSDPARDPAAKPAEPAAPPPAAAKGRTIPNSDGLVIDAPAKWKDNGIGGAAGMHLDADAGMFMVRALEPDEAARSLADWKAETEQVMFQSWISAEELPEGGFKALYAMDKIKMDGDEPVKDGTTYAFHVRRKLGDKPHDCYGSAATQETAAEALDLCLKVATR